DREDVRRREPLAVLDDLHVGVERLDRRARALGLRRAEAVRRVEDLALEVRLVDDVVVDDPERADPRGGEVDRGRTAEAARADAEDLCAEELRLALLADLGDREVTKVAPALRLGERGRRDERQARLLPAVEALDQRRHALVAQGPERLRGEERADAAGAV